MFKNCCGCSSKKAKRKESEEDDDDEGKKEDKERDNQINKVIEEEEKSAKVVAQKEAAAAAAEPTQSSRTDNVESVSSSAAEEAAATAPEAKRKPSMKKPKPRLSISTEVKIIPSNFPETMPDYPDDAEETVEESKTGDDDEEDEDETVALPVKNIDGKIIKKSLDLDDNASLPPPQQQTDLTDLTPSERPISPLSDEVFVANEKSALELPLHNMGFRIGSTQTTGTMLDVAPPVRSQSVSATQTPKRSSMPAVLHKWLSEEDDEFGGTHEPPATPVARDELALRRHRFFSELLTVAQAATEHRVRFDPFGPTVERLSDVDQTPQPFQAKEFEALLTRLENITTRLEKAVPALEKTIEPIQSSVVVTKSLEDLLDEHLTPAEKKNLNLLIGRTSESSESKRDDPNVISPDSSADIEDLSDKEITLDLGNGGATAGNGSSDKLLNGQSDRSENSTDSQSTVVRGSELDGTTVAGGEEEVVDSPRGGETAGGDRKREENGECGQDTMTNNQSTLAMSVQGFQDILQGPFATYLQVSSKIGGDVAEHSKLVQQAFQAQLQYLSMASQSSRPSDDENNKLLKPTSDHIMAIQNYREKHRASTYFNHLSAISESIPALGWVTVSPTPAPYVKEMNDAGQFYTNRVLKDWKEKDKIHADWTKAWVQTLSELQAFVKQHHTTGLVWSGTSAPRVGGIPPPPPVGMPPPPPVFDIADVAPGDKKQDRSALFAEINQGENITKGLKKVTADMQTHKNPAIRTGPAPFKAPAYVTNQSPMPYKAPSPPEKPPKFAREGKKWIIEHQKNNNELVVSGAEMNNVVYIYKCVNSTVDVKGKVNSIFVDSCKKTAVVFENVVSSIEFVNCQSVQMQVLGKVPTISVDKTDGCQMYLSKDSLDTEIISSKSSEMNVLVPTGSSGDFAEHPIPEQFKTTIGQKGLSTIAVENKG